MRPENILHSDPYPARARALQKSTLVWRYVYSALVPSLENLYGHLQGDIVPPVNQILTE